jgi:hypothetical protein
MQSDILPEANKFYSGKYMEGAVGRNLQGGWKLHKVSKGYKTPS